jgi:hypothetical protein
MTTTKKRIEHEDNLRLVLDSLPPTISKKLRSLYYKADDALRELAAALESMSEATEHTRTLREEEQLVVQALTTFAGSRLNRVF